MVRADRLAAFLLLCLVPLACGGSGEDDAGDGPLADVRDTLGEDTTMTPQEPPPAADVDTTIDRAAGVEREDTALDPGPGAVDPGAETPRGAEPEAPAGAGNPALPDWTTDEVSWQPPERPRSPVLADLRWARNEGFDRWVVEMRGEALPGYRVRYVDEPLRECGSGRQIHPEGDGWLELELEPAQGHTDAGEATVPREVDTPALTEGVHVYRTCDFEGHVTFVMAVRSPEPFRAFHLREPARVVVDVRH